MIPARAAEVIPPAPPNHFNDYAGVVSSGAAQSLDAELTQFERDTSNQIVVAIYPRLQSDSSIEDYTVRVAQEWGVGQRDKKNGAVLFIFTQDRKLYIQVGYGLEGALPDATCKQIISNEITPRFRQGDFSGGITAGVHAMMAATKGEYKGTGRTVAESGRSSGLSRNQIAQLLFLAVFVIIILRRMRNDVFGSRGRRSMWMGPTFWGGGGGGSSGGGGGGFSGGGGGSFSGGGGSFGGGGAGGSW